MLSLWNILTLFLVLPGFLGFKESVEDLPTWLNATEDIVAGSDPLEELCIGVVTGSMVGNVGQVQPHRLHTVRGLVGKHGELSYWLQLITLSLFVSTGTSSSFFLACLAGVEGLLGLGNPNGLPQSAIGSSFNLSDLNTSE